MKTGPKVKSRIGEQITTTKCGVCEIIEYTDSAKPIKVRFLATGTEKYVRYSAITRGTIKDPMHPTLYNVGYLGEGEYPASVNGYHHPYYRLWSSMFERVYDPKHKSYSLYGGNGVEICEEWHCYQTFAAWCDKNNYRKGLQLDKDIKQGNNKFYSPEYCMIVTPKENSDDAIMRGGRPRKYVK